LPIWRESIDIEWPVNDPVSSPPSSHRPKLGLVLAGGAARGAYEVGVLQHIVEDVSRELGYEVPLDILCGTSVGAINVCCLAAWADEPRARVARLEQVWTGLRIAEVLRPTTTGVVDTLRGFFGHGRSIMDATALFEPTLLEQLLRRSIPFERIDTHLRAGRFSAVTVSATQIATGRTMVFVQRQKASPAPWAPTPAVVPRSVRLRAVHVLASAAVPLLFPAVPIDGRFYCDGGLRQNIPLSPARRLGAHSLIVINPKHRPGPGHDYALEHDREEHFPSPLFLLGKTFNALLLDRIDNELDRLDKINEIIDAGCRAYGPDFPARLSEELGYEPPRGLRKLTTVHIRSSVNIGEMAADYVRSPDFQVPGLLGSIMKGLASGEATREADLLSYLLFDGAFARQLIEIGRADGRRHHDELCALFEALRTD
jgi:NTE family protein